ncbi:MAG: hypothetical protein HY028_11780 [Gammaproteobacteria bacterium]|nr:hypothetical protein [Gammaproteobacteria bacterium]
MNKHVGTNGVPTLLGSTFSRYVKQGIYPVDWGAADTRLEEGTFGE